MRTFRPAALALVAALIGLTAALASAASAESTTSAYASRLVQLINDARAQQGLRALTVTSGTSTVAGAWTQHLASAQALSHNPDLAHQLETHGSPDWTAYGEDVGEASSSSADQLFTAYMNSPEHRANILGSAYRYLGVGVVFTGDTAWNTLDFVDQYSSSTSTTTSTKTTTTKTSTTTSHSSTPRVTRSAPKAAPKPAPAVVRQTTRTVSSHPAVVHQPRTTARLKQAAVKGVASTAPHAAPRVAVADSAPSVVPVAASLPAPIHLPSSGGHRLPILVAASALVAVVAARFLVTIRAAAA